jgi:1-acyl-sn-glycerol-3-phosphate acyltransferase
VGAVEPLSALVEIVGTPILTTAIRFELRGLDHIPPKGPVILVSNHIAFVDPPCLFYVGYRRRRRVRFLAMAELFAAPVLGAGLRRLGHIPVVRASPEAGAALTAALAALRRGECVGIFPEGGISRDLEPQAGQTGAVRLAQSSGAPIVPVGLWGTQRIAGPGRRMRIRLRQPVVASVGPPVEVGPDDDIREATDRIMEAICGQVAAARVAYPEPGRPGDDWWVRPPHTAVVRSCRRASVAAAADTVGVDPPGDDPVAVSDPTSGVGGQPVEQQLRVVPFFRNVPADALAAVAAQLRPERYGPGDIIFRQDDPGDTLYVVASGQVEVIAGADSTPLASLGPGSIVGELAILLGEPRSATLRASAESVLWALRRRDLDDLLSDHPTIGVELSRELGRRLVATNRRIAPPLATRLTAVAGPGGASLAAALQALPNTGRIGVLPLPLAPDSPPPDGVVSMNADDLEPETLRTMAGRTIESLTHLLIILGPSPTPLARAAVEVAEHVVSFGSPPEWAVTNAGRHRVLRADGGDEALSRAARWVAGRAVGLALSSGGSKALAHLGVLRVLRRNGVVIDAVAGTSGGALVGAGLAFGHTEEAMLAYAAELAGMLRFRRFDFNVPPRSAIFKGARLRAQLHTWFEGCTFDDAGIPCWVVATDVATGSEVVINSGSVADGVRASMSIPGAMNPWPVGDRLCIDGAVVNPMPASVLRDAGLRLVIGSNVAGQELSVEGWAPTPHLLQIMGRMVNSMEREMVKAQVPLVDLLIRPAVGAASSFDFSRLGEFVAEGERAAEAQLADLKAALQNLSG